MNFLNKIYAWFLKNYIKLISFLLVISLAYGAYLYFYFMAQQKDQEAGDLFLNFYNSYSPSDFNDQEYNIVFDEISLIDNASIYLVMLKSIYAVELAESNDLQKGLTELSNARERAELTKEEKHEILTHPLLSKLEPKNSNEIIAIMEESII